MIFETKYKLGDAVFPIRNRGDYKNKRWDIKLPFIIAGILVNEYNVITYFPTGIDHSDYCLWINELDCFSSEEEALKEIELRTKEQKQKKK